MINDLVLFNPPIIHAAFADMDATYGAYVAVGNTTVNDTKNSARLLLDRLTYVGPGAMTGHARRAIAQERFAAARRHDHWLFRRRHW